MELAQEVQSRTEREIKRHQMEELFELIAGKDYSYALGHILNAAIKFEELKAADKKAYGVLVQEANKLGIGALIPACQKLVLALKDAGLSPFAVPGDPVNESDLAIRADHYEVIGEIPHSNDRRAEIAHSGWMYRGEVISKPAIRSAE